MSRTFLDELMGADPLRLVPRDDDDVGAPSESEGGVRVYYSSDAGGVVQKDVAGVVSPLGGGGSVSFFSGTPSPLGTAGAGDSTLAARGNHVHAHGDLAGGTLHALASGSAAGFMSAAHYTKVEALPTAATINGRTLTAGAGLTGGGDLSANRTFAVGANADGSIVVNADDIQVGVLATDAQHGTLGGGTLHALASGSAAGFMSAAHYTKVAALPATSVGTTRTISTTAPLTGGGDLSADRTLAVSNATTLAVGVVRLAGDLAGSATSVTVAKVNGASLPAAGALTIGDVPLVSGVSALTYGKIANANIAPGAAIDVSKLAPGTNGHVLATTGGAVGWVATSTLDHGAIGGLGDDDHTQYLLASGARALTSDWNAGTTRRITLGGLTFGATPAAGGDLRVGASWTARGRASSVGNPDAILQSWDGATLQLGDNTAATVTLLANRIATGGGWEVVIGATQMLAVTASGIDANGLKITDVGSPSASADAATKGYVDTLDANAVYRNGSRALTANWDAGQFLITAGNFAAGTATASTGSFRVGKTGTVTALNHAGSGDTILIGAAVNDVVVIGSGADEVSIRPTSRWEANVGGADRFVVTTTEITAALPISGTRATLSEYLAFGSTVANAGDVRVGEAFSIRGRSGANSFRMLEWDNAGATLHVGNHATVANVGAVKLYATSSGSFGFHLGSSSTATATLNSATLDLAGGQGLRLYNAASGAATTASGNSAVYRSSTGHIVGVSNEGSSCSLVHAPGAIGRESAEIRVVHELTTSSTTSQNIDIDLLSLHGKSWADCEGVWEVIVSCDATGSGGGHVLARSSFRRDAAGTAVACGIAGQHQLPLSGSWGETMGSLKPGLTFTASNPSTIRLLLAPASATATQWFVYSRITIWKRKAS